MSWSQKEKVIKEKRTIEATKKNIMGPTGKIGIIARVFGSPIMSESNLHVDSYYMDDPYEDYHDSEYEKTISGQNGPKLWTDQLIESEGGAGSAEETNPNFLGYTFDGLSRGMHIEIQYMRTEHMLRVYYKGYEVYREVTGELELYSPFPEWEDMINKIYNKAKEKNKEIKEFEKQELSKILENKKASFWQKLRLNWGI